MDLFQLLSSPDVNWWTGVVWIIVMCLSDSHSDGTHSPQSIHCWDTDAFLQIWRKYLYLEWPKQIFIQLFFHAYLQLKDI